VTEPYWSDDQVRLYLGDALEVLREMEPASIDAVVTDPPYGIGFMGKPWDGDAIREAAQRDRDTRKSLGPASASRPGRTEPRSSSAFGNEAIIAGPVRGGHDFQEWCEAWARECLRVLKPGGHMLAFGGTRTWHRLTCAIEDAGFEIRDSVADLTGHDAPGLMWVYGSGFPKSLNVSAAIDKAAGATRAVVGVSPDSHARTASSWQADDGAPHGMVGRSEGERLVTAPATEHAAAWSGWGTALKPAWEPIVVARKPLAGTVAANVLEHATGALNIAECRVGTSKDVPASPKGQRENPVYDGIGSLPGRSTDLGFDPDTGRWPPNVLLGAEAAAELDRQSGVRTSGDAPKHRGPGALRDAYGEFTGQQECAPGRAANEGGASRFFPVFKYEPKASAEERPRLPDGTAHPTVKPRDLIAWLVRLVSTPGALILDPFAGSGTTAEACVMEGRRCVLIEQHEPYAELAKARLSRPIQPGMFDLEAS
jgi:site-specific DNA-methyltransferase (adenine-specific)